MSLSSPDRHPRSYPRPVGPEVSEADVFKLRGPVGVEAANDRDDVIRAQILLAHTGDYDMARLGGPTGWASSELFRAMRRYQSRKGRTVDGVILPDGETMASLHDDLGELLSGQLPPTADDVDRHHEVIAAHRAAGHDTPRPRTALVMPGENEPAWLRRGTDVVSDVEPPQPPAFQAGAQIAQATTAIQQGMLTAPGAAARNRPANAKIAREIEKRVEDTINLLTLPVQVQRYMMDDTPPALPSILLDPAIAAATKTPPRMPSAPEEPPPEGSKPEEREPSLEELIPPELKPWAEGLEPFDQQLARELLLIYNRRGGPSTIKGNAIGVKEAIDAFKKYKALASNIKHVGGSHLPDNDEPGHENKNNYREERYYQNKQTEGRKGASWADITFEIKSPLSKELGFEYLHLSSARLLKDGKTAISDEREKKARLERNHPESRVVFMEKPATVKDIPYDWKSYQARIKDFAERLAEELDAMREENR